MSGDANNLVEQLNMAKKKRFKVERFSDYGYGIFDNDKNEFVKKDKTVLTWRKKYVALNWLSDNLEQLESQPCVSAT